MPKFKNLPQNVSFTALEEDTIKFWKDNKIFAKSIESRPEGENYSFYDGPPFNLNLIEMAGSSTSL